MSSYYLFLTLLFVVIQGLFAFFEMSCVSFNKVRLQYYVSRNSRRAIWLNYLLKRPTRLFGTTLIGITTSLVIGSECSRHFYESIHLDPDWAPLTQIPLVVIFGELAPMFAARRHPEQAAMICVPFMIILARIFSPITWAFDFLSEMIHKAMGKEKETALFLSREEVRMAFEAREEGQDEFNTAVGQIFKLKNLTAGQLMIPISNVEMIPSFITVGDLRKQLSVKHLSMLPVFHRVPHNIVAIAILRDLVKLDEDKKVIDSAHSPWFVSRDTPIFQLLQQFSRNNQSIAVILDSSGQASGIITFDQIFDAIFGEERGSSALEKMVPYVQRTFSGDMSVAEFNFLFGAQLKCEEGDTLSDLILKSLDHLPVKDESVRIDDYEFTVDEPTLRGVKSLSVRSIQD